MSTIRHLQQQRNELQKSYELLCTLLQNLGERLVVETDTVEEFKLLKQKERIEAKRTHIDEQIECLDVQIEALDIATRLHKALLKLNYHHQETLFQRLVDKSQIG